MIGRWRAGRAATAALPDEVDVVVVGAGSSGCVVAAKLSADGARSVLLVEAGPDRPVGEGQPADLADARRNSMRPHDWGLWHRTGRGWMPMPYPRGKVVGGSSAVNTCIALRGDPADFNAWAARGLPEWSWEQVLPAFCAIETDHDFDGPWHGRDGPLPLRRPTSLTPWQAAFVAAAERLGYPRVADHHAPGATGVGPHAFNRDASLRRINAAEAWLTPAVRARPNLRLVDRTIVDRIRFERGVAQGVDVVTEGRERAFVPARRVVLCAGAIHTPGVLLRSGLGPTDALARLGVAQVAELPGVSRTLLDHAGTALFFRPRPGVAQRGDPIMQTALRFASSDVGRPNDLQIQPGGNTAFDFPWVTMISLMAHVGLPAGTAELRWTSADPFAAPEIRSNLMLHPRDARQAVEAMRIAVRLWQTPEMRDLATPLWPNPRVWDRDEDALAQVRLATDSGYHPCGTAPMGPDEDPWAVCDGRGRVRRVEGVWVADASLMPEVPSGNIHLPTLMIGERVAGWIAG